MPVYNEEKTLKQILTKTTKLNIDNYEVIIVDDSSFDSSPQIIEDFVKSFNSSNVLLKTYRHSKNLGKGAGIQTGLKHAKGEYFVIQDADLEYDPKDIVKILKKAVTNNYDVVYGSRFLGNIKKMPRANYFANIGYNIILRILYRTKITDMHTCYKMVRTKILKKIKISSNGFDYATEMISKLLNSGYVIHEVPVKFNGRTKKEGKKINVMDGVECAYKLFIFKINKNKKLDNRTTTLLRFLAVGFVGFLTNYAVLVLLTQFNLLNYVYAEIIAAFIALQVTFILHERWTYQQHSKEKKTGKNLLPRYAAYFTSNAFGSIMTVLAFSFLYQYTIRVIALLIAASVGIVWNYLLNTYIIWRRKL